MTSKDGGDDRMMTALIAAVELERNTVMMDPVVDTNCSWSTPDLIEKMNYSLDVERSMSTRPVYMERQPHMTKRKRSILVRRMKKVHLKLELGRDVLGLAVNLLDRYLSMKLMSGNRSKGNLVGMTCLLVASKFHDTDQHEALGEYLCSPAYPFTGDDIAETEMDILTTLDYHICIPTAHTFLHLYNEFNVINERITEDSLFILDHILPYYHLLDYLPSEVARGAIYIARAFDDKHPWSLELEVVTGYKESDVIPVARGVYHPLCREVNDPVALAEAAVSLSGVAGV